MLSLFGRPRAISFLATASIAAIVSSLQPAAAQAQARAFNIQPQPLSSALIEFSAQSDTRVIADPALVNGRRSPGVIGSYAPDDALEHILAGTGLRLSRNGGGGLTVIGESASPTQLGANNQTAPSEDGADIVVTGTRLNRSVDNGFPVNTYSRDDIETSGQPNLGAFLTTLNEVSVVTPASGAYSSTNRNTTVQLRGLPLGTTLTLINGRRAQSSSSASTALMFDLGSIPFDAVDHVDIVPVGSSAIYGGDALAGVVNVVLKRSIDGVALSGNYGFADDTENYGVSLAAGREFERGSLLVMAAWSETTPLTTLERDFFLDADYRRFGGPDARVRTCTPGTVTNAGAGNLPGLGSTFAGIPDLAPGAPVTIAAFQPNAGAPNLCAPFSEGSGSQLVNGVASESVHIAGDFEVLDWLTLFGEATYNSEHMYSANNGITLSNLLVPASNAYNPFGVDVRVTSMLSAENGVSANVRDTEFLRAVAGLRGDFANGWDFEASVLATRDETDTITTNALMNSAARTAALASSDPTTALNPFTSGRAASEAVLRGIWYDRSLRVGDAGHDQINAFVRGDLPGLPSGEIHFVVGAEASRDTWATSGITFANNMKRTSEALFAEANIPLLGSDTDDNRHDLLSLSLATRLDSFSDFGDATTYQIGLEARPVESLHLRLATATSFKPPSLLQLSLAPTTYTTEIFGLRDPLRANEAIVGGMVQYGPNPNLGEETGEATTFGLIWEPTFAPGLRLAATAWQVEIEGLISLLQPQTILDNESLFPAQITRGPSVGGMPGLVTQVDVNYVNFGSVSVSGVDYEIGYSHDTAWGKLSLSASATQTDTYDAALTPGAASQNRVSRRFLDFWAPEWKGRVSAGLEGDGWNIGAAGRYVGPYLDEGVSTRELGDRWVFDLSAGVNVLSERTRLLVTIANVTDEMPEFAGTSGAFYDMTQGDWRGRFSSVRLTTRF